MKWSLCGLSVVLLVLVVADDPDKVLRIPLLRQKTARESGMNVNNINGHSTDWLRPNPKQDYPKNDTIGLFRYLDSEFYGVVRIGQKAKAFNMILDTTWAHSWVLSADCALREIGCWFHNKYDHTSSSTYVKNGTSFVKHFSNFNMTGYLSEDVFYFDHKNCTNQTFAEVRTMPWYNILSRADGVIGLAYSSLSPGVTPVLYNLYKQGKIAAPLFSVYLNRDRSSNRGGNIILGAVDKRHVLHPDENDFTYLAVNQTTGYWQFQVDRIVVTAAKKSYPLCLRGCQAISDSGTNTITGPAKDVATIHQRIKAKYLAFGRYEVSCDTVNKLPEIAFVLAGKSFPLQGRDYVQRISYMSFTLCLSAFVAQTEDGDQSMWNLGGAFLAEYYSVYDLTKNVVGFVKAA